MGCWQRSALSVQELETICGLIDLDVPADKKGKKKEVRKLLSKELNKDTEDDNQGGWILIHDLLFPDPEKNATVKVEPVAASDAGDTKNTKTSETQLGHSYAGHSYAAGLICGWTL